MYVEHTVEILREIRRVLRLDGACFWNIGDSYAGGKGQSGQPLSAAEQNLRAEQGDSINRGHHQMEMSTRPSDSLAGLRSCGLKPKDLCLIPFRVALAAQADGWWVRSAIIWCLSGGTWVYTRTQKGDMPMMLRDAARLRPETVQLWNGSRWTRVLGWSRSPRQANELEIVLRSGERISCTPSHKFPTTYGLKKAGELVRGDVLSRVTLPEPDKPKDSAHIALDAAWLAGLYIAEGSRSEDTVQIAGHAKEEGRWLRLRKIAATYGGSATRTVDGNSMNVRLYGKLLVAVLDTLVSGKTAKDKCLSVECWKYSNAFLREVLNGYLSGDGHSGGRRWRLGFTRNYNLERDFRTLAARLNFHLVLHPCFVKYQGKKRPIFRGELRFERSGHHNEKQSSEIVDIRKSRCREIYDVGVVDEPHVFALASGMLTHNSKPNPMPESVTDRPTDAYEHILMLTKSERYFWDAEAVKEQGSPNSESRYRYQFKGVNEEKHEQMPSGRDTTFTPGMKQFSSTRNLRNVWTFPTQPYKGAHFAAFPEELPRRCILAATSAKGSCRFCGAPWERVERIGRIGNPLSSAGETKNADFYIDGSNQLGPDVFRNTKTLGWRPTCTCKGQRGETVPCVVLDPFGGSGTTGRVAVELKRTPILIDLAYNGLYGELAAERTSKVQMEIFA